MKVSNGFTIGGYINATLISPQESTFVKDDQAFLFNLSLQDVLKNQNPEKALLCRIDLGPTFGFKNLRILLL